MHQSIWFKDQSIPLGHINDKTHTILVGIWHTQEINNQYKVAYLRSLVVLYEKGLVNKNKHTIYANSKLTKSSNLDQTIYM